MNRTAGGLLLAAFVLLVAWAGYRSAQQASQPEGGEKELAALLHQPATDLQGRPHTLAEWQGKLLVINLWASWCPPCRAEMPGFSRLQRKYQERGVQFLGLALDDADAVRDFLATTPVAYPVLIAPPEQLVLSASLGNSGQGLPFTLIVDAQGRLAAVKLGLWRENELDAAISAQLSGKQPSSAKP